jgi:hypothetical protein
MAKRCVAGQSQGVHLLAAYRPQEGVVLLQVEVGAKENEISAAPRVLQQLDLRGILVSGDAMFTQRSLCLQIVQQGGDYLLPVKENQPTLYDDIDTLFAPAAIAVAGGEETTDFRRATTIELGHGRRDGSLQEDRARVRMGQAPHVQSVLNNTVVGLFLKHQYENMAAGRRELDATINRALFQQSLAG